MPLTLLTHLPHKTAKDDKRRKSAKDVETQLKTAKEGTDFKL